MLEQLLGIDHGSAPDDVLALEIDVQARVERHGGQAVFGRHALQHRAARKRLAPLALLGGAQKYLTPEGRGIEFLALLDRALVEHELGEPGRELAIGRRAGHGRQRFAELAARAADQTPGGAEHASAARTRERSDRKLASTALHPHELGRQHR